MDKLKISMNAECPCQSGEKYKKCHLGKLSVEQEEYFAFLQYNNKVKNKLLKWFLFSLDLDEQDYYAKNFGVKSIQVIKNLENPAEFFEWLFYQAKEKNTKEGVLKYIIERYPDIFSSEELWFIRERSNNNQAGIFEVVSSDEKSWKITLKEYYTKEVYDIKDRLGSLDTATGDLLLTRIEKIFSKYYLCGFGKRIPRNNIDEFTNFFNNEFENRKKELPLQKYDDFMNKNFRELTFFEPSPTKFLSNNGNELKICEGKFKTKGANIALIIDYLKESEDFVIIRLNKKKDNYHAEFIKKNTRKESILKMGNAQKMSFVAVSPDGEKIEYSGSVKINMDNIKIFSNSEETYNEIINILESLIKSKLIVKSQVIETPEDILAKNKNKPSKDEREDPDILIKKGEFLKEYYIAWCDEKIPSLNNKTPRECTKSDEGRRLLNELLLDIKNLDEHQRKSGKNIFPAEEFIRKTLNFYE